MHEAKVEGAADLISRSPKGLCGKGLAAGPGDYREPYEAGPRGRKFSLCSEPSKGCWGPAFLFFFASCLPQVNRSLGLDTQRVNRAALSNAIRAALLRA